MDDKYIWHVWQPIFKQIDKEKVFLSIIPTNKIYKNLQLITEDEDKSKVQVKILCSNTSWNDKLFQENKFDISDFLNLNEFNDEDKKEIINNTLSQFRGFYMNTYELAYGENEFGKYGIQPQLISNKIYQITTGSDISTLDIKRSFDKQENNLCSWNLYAIGMKEVIGEEQIADVESEDKNAYPIDGYEDGKYYKLWHYPSRTL